ncbi:MAG: BrnT family toxin [Burkholderiales bacterium]|nr:BrnT family toxin [Burkholderiales bacterium]
MRYEFDPTKDDGNLEKHGLSLVDAEGFEWETAVVHEDTRKQYAEPRFQAAGYIGNRLHVMVFCLRADTVRVISLRKANPREVKSYAET